MTLARKIILSVLYIVVVVGLSLAIILSFTHKTTSPEATKPSTTHHVTTATKSSPTSTATTSTSATTTNQNTSKTSNLTNTGPGDVVAIFVVSTVIAATLHWLVRSRKLYLN